MAKSKKFIGIKVKFLIILYVLTIIPLVFFSGIVLHSTYLMDKQIESDVEELGDQSVSVNEDLSNDVITQIRDMTETAINNSLSELIDIAETELVEMAYDRAEKSNMFLSEIYNELKFLMFYADQIYNNYSHFNTTYNIDFYSGHNHSGLPGFGCYKQIDEINDFLIEFYNSDYYLNAHAPTEDDYSSYYVESHEPIPENQLYFFSNWDQKHDGNIILYPDMTYRIGIDEDYEKWAAEEVHKCMLFNIVFKSIGDKYNDNIDLVWMVREGGFHNQYPYFDYEKGLIEDPSYFINIDDDKEDYVLELNEENNPERKIKWLNPYIDETTFKWMVSAIGPIYNTSNDEFIGTIGIDLLIDDLRKTILDMKIETSGYGFLIDSNGAVIAMPQEGIDDLCWNSEHIAALQNILENNDDNEHLKDLENALASTTLNSNPDPAISSVINDMISMNTNISLIQLDGEAKYIAYAPIENTGWSLGLVVPRSEIISSLAELKSSINETLFNMENVIEENSGLQSEYINDYIEKTNANTRLNTDRVMMDVAIILFLTLGVTISASLILSDSITAPLKRLTGLSHSLSNGRFNRKIRIKSNDEFELLANSFNTMGLRLEESYRHLEEKVKERTGELEKSNDELVVLYKELQQTQEQLIQSEKMAALGELIAGIAHEINNPVSFIYGNMEPMNDLIKSIRSYIEVYSELAFALEKDDIKGVKKSMDKLRKLSEIYNIDLLIKDLQDIQNDTIEGAKRVREIVVDLKNFSRVGSAEMRLIDIHEGIESSLKMLHSQLSDRIEVQKSYGRLPKINCYPFELNQVFLNILNNSTQAISNKGSIWVTTLDQPDHIEVMITDSGSGIPKKELHRIFDPFYTTKPTGQGTGLGLSICYKIVEKHGGTIKVKSKSGIGTEITIKLPKKCPEKSNRENTHISKNNVMIESDSIPEIFKNDGNSYSGKENEGA